MKEISSFSIKLLKESKTKQTNCFMSPISILCAVSMLVNGCSKEIQKEFEKTVGISVNDMNQYSELFIKSISESNALKTANSIWVTSEYIGNNKINDEYQKAMKKYYGQEVRKEELINIVAAINRWCDKNTNGMIDNILSEGDIDQHTMFELVNAIAFDAKWDVGYSQNKINTILFQNSDGSVKEVDSLKNKTETFIGTKECGLYKMYEGYRYCFGIIMPNNMDNYLHSRSESDLVKIMTRREVDVKGVKTGEGIGEFPKFKSEYSDYGIKEKLNAIGFKKLTETSCVDGIIRDRVGSMDSIVHKAVIDVNEERTRAAAVTAIGVKMACFRPEQPINIKINKPFLYFITDMELGIPIFLGIQNKF